MQKLLYVLIVLSMLICPVTSSKAQVSIGIGLPNVSIGINLPLFPHLVPVPGYPVYYAPEVDANYFFYDGMYWVYQHDNWYASSWYNGPWSFVEPEVVPLFVLRIPVHYYRQPPMYFRGWQSNSPPRWGQHWGHGWEQQRRGWDRWKHSSAPAPAPLPVYQRRYYGDRYPRVEQQHTLRSQSYRYQPRDKVIRQHFQQQAGPNAPAPVQQRRKEVSPAPQPPQRSMPLQHVAPVPHVQPTAPQQNKPQVTPQQRQQPASQEKRKQEPGLQGQEQRPQDSGDKVVRRHFQQQAEPKAPAPVQQRRQEAPPVKSPRQQDIQRPAPHQQVVPPAPRPQPPQVIKQQLQRSKGKNDSQEPNQGNGQGHKNDEDRGHGRNK